MFFALLRKQAFNSGVHFRRLLWCLRVERGESTGRLHFHAVIAGFNPSWVHFGTCKAFEKLWQRVGGGWATVMVYSQTSDGLDYILKGELTGLSAARFAGDYHELTKFGGSCEVTLSESVVFYLQNRRRQRSVVQVRGQLRRCRKDTASDTRQRTVSNSAPLLLVTGSATTSHIKGSIVIG